MATNGGSWGLQIQEVKKWLSLLILGGLDELQRQIIAEPVLFRSVHHVGFAIPQGFHCMKNINHTLSLGHLTHNAAGTEYSTTATSI